MVSTGLKKIDKISAELTRCRSIPASYQTVLEERLAIACKPLGRQPRSKVPRTMKNIRSHSKNKTANRVYLEVLDNVPHTFLPFIIAISPRACESFNLSNFFQQQRNSEKIDLNDNVKSSFEDIAQKQGFNHSPVYKRVIELLFSESQSPIAPKPITSAENNKHWAYHAADLRAIRIVFGDYICDAIESAPRRIGEKHIYLTECVRTNLPRQNFQDGVMLLDVGPARDIAGALFSTATCIAVEPSNNSDQEIEDHAYYTLKGASISGIATIFSPRICEAIEKCSLRIWEKQHLLADTTDCVTMQMYRKEPHYGTIRLRLEFFMGIHIANNIYADANIV